MFASDSQVLHGPGREIELLLDGEPGGATGEKGFDGFEAPGASGTSR